MIDPRPRWHLEHVMLANPFRAPRAFLLAAALGCGPSADPGETAGADDVCLTPTLVDFAETVRTLPLSQMLAAGDPDLAGYRISADSAFMHVDEWAWTLGLETGTVDRWPMFDARYYWSVRLDDGRVVLGALRDIALINPEEGPPATRLFAPVEENGFYLSHGIGPIDGKLRLFATLQDEQVRHQRYLDLDLDTGEVIELEGTLEPEHVLADPPLRLCDGRRFFPHEAVNWYDNGDGGYDYRPVARIYDPSSHTFEVLSGDFRGRAMAQTLLDEDRALIVTDYAGAYIYDFAADAIVDIDPATPIDYGSFPVFAAPDGHGGASVVLEDGVILRLDAGGTMLRVADAAFGQPPAGILSTEAGHIAALGTEDPTLFLFE